MNQKKTRKRRKRDYMGLVYIAPWLIGFLLLQLYPFFTSLYYSFCKYDVLNPPEWIGLQNYINLFTKDREFMKSLIVTIKFTIITVPGKLIVSLLVAMLLNTGVKGINFIRTIYYIPSLFGGSVAVAVLWKILFMNDGMMNTLFETLGLPHISWLGDPNVALMTICLLEIWQFGSSMVMFLAALKQVPVNLYEAAAIDGAGKWKSFWKITIPQISPIIFFNLIMQTINALQSYTNAAVITDGGPLKSTYLLGIKLYSEAFLSLKYGYASAVSWIIFLLIMGVTVLLFRSSSVWVHYADDGEF